MLKPCIICYRPNPSVDTLTSPGVGRSANVQKVPGNGPGPGVLKQFFRLLESYLTDKPLDGGENAMNSLFEKLIDVGILCCGGCSKIVESFHSLHQQMTDIQLQLDRNVRGLADTMSSARENPARMKCFEEGFTQLEIEEVGIAPEEILECRKELIKKCRHKLARSLPRSPHNKCTSLDGVSQPEQAHCSETFPMRIFIEAEDSEEKDEDPLADLKLESVGEAEELNYLQNASTTIKQEVPDEERLEAGMTSAEDKHHSDLLLNEDDFGDDMSGSTDSNEDAEHPLPTNDEEGFNPPILVNPELAAQLPPTIIDPLTRKRKCDLCPNLFTTNWALITHYRSVHLQVKYKCRLCQKELGNRSRFNSHNKKVHLRAKLLRCSVCDKLFENEAKLSQHAKNVHLDPQPDDEKGLEVDMKTEYDHDPDLLLNEDDSEEEDLPGSTYTSDPLTNDEEEGLKGFNPPIIINAEHAAKLPPKIIDPVTRKRKCHLCPKLFTKSWSCVLHYRSVHLQVKYKCGLCQQEFSRRDHFNSHNKRDHILGTLLRCSVCNKLFEIEAKLIQHAKTVHLNPQPGDEESLEADMTTEDEHHSGLLLNEVDSEEEGPLNNDEEVAGFNPPIIINAEHAAKLPPKIIDPLTRKHKCHLCPKLFTKRGSCILHYRSIHLQVKYKCGLCQTEFSHRGHFNLHNKRDHIRGELLRCRVCNKLFENEAELIQHTKDLHVDPQEIRLRVCEYCSVTFANRQALYVHVRNNCPVANPHNMSNPYYECGICHQKFASQRLKLEHQQDEHDGKKFGCQYCPKLFMSTSSIKVHKCSGKPSA